MQWYLSLALKVTNRLLQTRTYTLIQWLVGMAFPLRCHLIQSDNTHRDVGFYPLSNIFKLFRPPELSPFDMYSLAVDLVVHYELLLLKETWNPIFALHLEFVLLLFMVLF